MTLSRQHRAELKRRRGSALSPTAKSEHRAQAFALHRDNDGMVRCILRGRTGHVCGGGLQAHHVIEAQRLRNLWSKATGQSMYPGKPPGPEHLRLIGAVSLDALLRDGRNSAVVCELGHRQIELGRFRLPRLPHAIAFASEYAIEHELPAWADEPATKEAA